jgi:hypothetical protein
MDSIPPFRFSQTLKKIIFGGIIFFFSLILATCCEESNCRKGGMEPVSTTAKEAWSSVLICGLFCCFSLRNLFYLIEICVVYLST